MAKSLNLTDLELVLLSGASRRAEGHVHPLPKAAGADADRIGTALQSLLGRALLAEKAVSNARECWREQDDQRLGLVITDAGLAAINAEDGEGAEASEVSPASQNDSATAPATPKAGSKTERVVALLGREHGASLEDLVAATGWLPHTTRAALTALRKKGHAIERTKVEGVTHYILA